MIKNFNDGTSSGETSISWDTDDELEANHCFIPNEAINRTWEASSSISPGTSKLCQHFEGMGFPKKMVLKVIDENGTEDTEAILELLLTYSAVDGMSDEQEPTRDCFVGGCEGSDGDCDYDLSDSSEDEKSSHPFDDDNDKLRLLATMGYCGEEAAFAIDRCGPDSSIAELTDFICAAQIARAADGDEQNKSVKRRRAELDLLAKQKKPNHQGGVADECGDTAVIQLPNPMIGFGVPDEVCRVFRSLPETAVGPPFFYYENVALAPKGVWDTISRHLYDVEPEFVDSKYFCAANRKRGYVHNLPIRDRCPLLPLPARTIHDAFPLTERWWPSWDMRKKFNCLQTAIASAKLTDRVRKAVEPWSDSPEPPLHVQKYVLEECRRWNLVWVGRNKVAPLEPDEIELLLGFPRNHTRGVSRTDRYKSLGNSFQVDTVAYHLSVLKDMFPEGMTVLSLFTGIGGAEVALYRLGVRLKVVVSVEKLEANRNMLSCWWGQTEQQGELIHMDDVQRLTTDRIEALIARLGRFDLVIGGSPCNNLAGANRVSRDGLDGKESILFYEYYRILDSVRTIMRKNPS